VTVLGECIPPYGAPDGHAQSPRTQHDGHEDSGDGPEDATEDRRDLLAGCDDDRGPLDRVRVGELRCGDGVLTCIAGAERVDVVCRHTANIHTAAGCEPGERLLSLPSG